MPKTKKTAKAGRSKAAASARRKAPTPRAEATRQRARPLAVPPSRSSRSSAGSGRMSGALRSTASVRGRHGSRAPLEAAPTDSARRDAPAPFGRGERGRVDEPEHVPSPTAVAAEALRTGVVPNAIPPGPDDQAVPHEARKIRAGDPDDETLGNEYVGEDTPGGSTPTPDQSDVDDIGRAYGVQDEDSGALRTSSEVLDGRDKRRHGPDFNRRGR